MCPNWKEKKKRYVRMRDMHTLEIHYFKCLCVYLSLLIYKFVREILKKIIPLTTCAILIHIQNLVELFKTSMVGFEVNFKFKF